MRNVLFGLIILPDFFCRRTRICKEKIAATEPNQEARNVAVKRVGESVFNTINDEELEGKSFDIITLWHVLEHVHLLNETIEWLKKHLNPDGKIIIAKPNTKGRNKG